MIPALVRAHLPAAPAANDPRIRQGTLSSVPPATAKKAALAAEATGQNFYSLTSIEECKNRARKILQIGTALNKWGPRLGSGAPIGCVPVVRSRRDRTMGSSILASLSEAGGNDPLRAMSKPLPPRSQRSADRVCSERNPHLYLEQVNCRNI
jgi:hypothetical protein